MILRVQRMLLIIILLLVGLKVSAQNENAYLRQKVDSLERVIRELRYKNSKRNTISTLERDNDIPVWLSRTGYYDSLGEINQKEEFIECVNTEYSDINFIEFPYDNLISSMIETFSKAQTSLWGGILGRWFAYRDDIKDYFIQKGLPEELAMICVVESGCSPKAISKAGAAGFWQFMPQTGRDYGLRVDEMVDERLDIDKSTACAVEYFQKAYRTLGSWDAAIASYNCGIGNVTNAIKKYGNNIRDYYERLPEETQSYIPSLIAALWLEKNYKQTDIQPVPFDGEIIAKKISRDYTFTEIEQKTGIPCAILRRYNPQYIMEFIPGSEGVYYVKVNSKYRNALKEL